MMLRFVLTMSASASSTTMAEDGPVRWQGDGDNLPYVPIVINAANAAGLSGHQIEAAVVDGLLAWQRASGQAFTFDVWVGTEPSLFPTTLDGDGYTTLHFASRDPGAALGATQAGFTNLFFDGTSGAILEGDIVLNDVGFGLTADPEASSYTQEGLLGRTVVLSDLVTHELGHLLGLGHTGVATSTMFPGGWARQAQLGCDDVTAARQLYLPTPRGTLTGTLSLDRARLWAGIEVMAIDVDARRIASATFADADGHYTLPALPEGRYLVFASPYLGDPSELPPQIAEDFALPCDISRGIAGPVDVTGTTSVTVDLAMTCNGDIDLQRAQGTLSDPQDLVVDDEGRILAAFQIQTGNDGAWFRLPEVEGTVSLDLLSHSLFSPARVEGLLTQGDGSTLFTASSIHPLFEHHEAPIWDTRVEAYGVEGDVLLFASAYLLPPSSFPGGETFVDPLGFAIVMGTVDPEWQPPESCAPVDLGPYASPGGIPRPSWVEDTITDDTGCTTGPGPGAWGWIALLGLAARRRTRAD